MPNVVNYRSFKRPKNIKKSIESDPFDFAFDFAQGIPLNYILLDGYKR